MPAPPITPPMATASRASAMTHVPGSSAYVLWSMASIVSPVAGLADDDSPGPLSFA